MPLGINVGLWSLPPALTRSGSTLARTRLTKLSTRLGRSLGREGQTEEQICSQGGLPAACPRGARPGQTLLVLSEEGCFLLPVSPSLGLLCHLQLQETFPKGEGAAVLSKHTTQYPDQARVMDLCTQQKEKYWPKHVFSWPILKDSLLLLK